MFADRQRQQEVDAPSERHERVIKGAAFDLIGSLGLRRVFHPPVRENGLSGKAVDIIKEG